VTRQRGSAGGAIGPERPVVPAIRSGVARPMLARCLEGVSKELRRSFEGNKGVFAIGPGRTTISLAQPQVGSGTCSLTLAVGLSSHGRSSPAIRFLAAPIQ